MKKTNFFLIISLLLLQTALFADIRDPGEYFFDSSFGDYTEELATAKEEGKKGILVMFELDECPFCARMKKKVLNRSKVQDYYKKYFRILRVDIEGDIEITDFQGNETTMKEMAEKTFKVRATPVFQFIDLTGKPVPGGRYTGATKNSKEFLLLADFIQSDAWKKQNFTLYKKMRKNLK